MGITVLWAALWLPLGIGLGVWRYLAAPFSDEMIDGQLPRLPAFPIISGIAILWMLWGAISGFLFATILSGAERRRAVQELSIVRVSVWGALGAASLPSVAVVQIARQEGWSWWLLVPLIVAFAVGASCAALTALAARRGSRLHSSERAA